MKKEQQFKDEFLSQLDKQLSQMDTIEPPDFLLNKIISSIDKKIIFIWRLKLSFFVSFLFLFVYGFFQLWQSMIAQLIQTDVFNILSLIFSDSKIVLANWKYFSLYFIESLPMMPVLLICATTLVSLITIKILVQGFYNKNNLIFNK